MTPEQRAKTCGVTPLLGDRAKLCWGGDGMGHEHFW